MMLASFLSVSLASLMCVVLTLTGTAMVIGGAFVYNAARNHEDRLRALAENSNKDVLEV